GQSELEVSVVSMGCWPLAGDATWGPQDEALSIATGAPAGYTGMVWSGFRPSDDACTFPYLVPANMFAAVVLEHGAGIYRDVYGDEEMARTALRISREVRGGIERHGRVRHPDHGWVWAYEVDGLGGVNIMDDANIPSLLSAPYLGYVATDDP